MGKAFAEIAFTPAVQDIQKTQGSAAAYAKFLTPEAETGARGDRADRGDRLSERETGFIAVRDGFYQASVSETGWPYVQFRGGPAGFLQVLDDKTIGYADYRGNRQYVSVGNLSTDNRVSLILMDYPNQRRLKIWGHAVLTDVADDAALVDRLHVDGYKARSERAVIITVDAYDWNCPQHIPQRLTLDELEPHITPLKAELARLQAENQALRGGQAVG